MLVTRPGTDFGAILLITLSPAYAAAVFTRLGPFWFAQVRALGPHRDRLLGLATHMHLATTTAPPPPRAPAAAAAHGVRHLGQGHHMPLANTHPPPPPPPRARRC